MKLLIENHQKRIYMDQKYLNDKLNIFWIYLNFCEQHISSILNTSLMEFLLVSKRHKTFWKLHNCFSFEISLIAHILKIIRRSFKETSSKCALYKHKFWYRSNIELTLFLMGISIGNKQNDIIHDGICELFMFS